ncbi:MAG: ABC transporter permease [Gemmatimonadaceae bacterium]|nr:ABC transporter permease [Gemmatimonadaceae bacterium]
MGQVVAVTVAAATFAFVALHLAPGDAANALGDTATPAMREQLRQTYGLDQPLPTQYLRWVLTLARGDLGMSISEHRPVTALLATALPATAMLVLPAFALSALLGMGVGVWQAAWRSRRRDRWTDRLLLVVYSVPEFWLAMTLALLFARHWHLLPANGVTSDTYEYLGPLAQLKDRLAHLVMPVAALTAVGVATFARYQRDSMDDALRQPFVQTARAKGLARRRVLFSTWRVAALPVVTLAGLLLPAWLAGVVFVEQVFAWPGVGTLLLHAVMARDYPVVSGIVVVGSALTATSAAAAELLRAVVDPRVRTATGAPRTGTT